MTTTPSEPEIVLPESLRAGVYANFFAINVGSEETLLDFGVYLPKHGTPHPNEPSARQIVIVARVVVSRRGAEAIHEILGRMLKQVSAQQRSGGESGR